MALKLKVDDKGVPALSDGKLVFLKEDNSEITVDVEATLSRITALNGEAKSHRERAEAAEGKLKGFEGIADPKAALAALDTVSKLDQKKLIDAGQVDVVKAEITKAYEGRLSEQTKAREAAEKSLATEIIGGGFARSKFIADKFAAQGPAGVEIAQALFAKHFSVKDGKLVATGPDGQTIFSPTVERAGQPASFDEALGVLVSAYPHKESLLKGDVKGGSGSAGGSGGSGGKAINRQAFDALDPLARREHIKSGGTVTDQ